MRFILMFFSPFELQQEPMRFILVLHSTFELLIRIKPLNSYGLVLQSLD